MGAGVALRMPRTLKIRSSSEGLSAAFNWGANLLVSLTFLTLVQQLGASRTFWLYGVLAVGAWIFSYYFVPETRGRTLEEIERFKFYEVAGTPDVCLTIATGEQRIYANLLLTIGVVKPK